MFKTKNIKNGVNVDHITEMTEAIKQTPELAKFEFRAKNNWIDGGHSVTSIKSFYGAGQEDHSRMESFTIESDNPEILLGNNKAASPLEIALHALGSCLTTTIAYKLAKEGISIQGLESCLTGSIDFQGFLELDAKKLKGFDDITVKLKIKSEATEEQLREIMDLSPILDLFINPIPVKIELE